MILFFLVPYFLSSNLTPHLDSKYLENKDYHVVDVLYVILIKCILLQKNHNCDGLKSVHYLRSVVPHLYFRIINY